VSFWYRSSISALCVELSEPLQSDMVSHTRSLLVTRPLAPTWRKFTSYVSHMEPSSLRRKVRMSVYKKHFAGSPRAKKV